MFDTRLDTFLRKTLQLMPVDWLKLTTHRLDIYHEERAKSEFLEGVERLYAGDSLDQESLAALPTAYDYIRLGHPLSSLLEWSLAKQWKLEAEQVISFSSQSMPLLAVLRHHRLAGQKTTIYYREALPKGFDAAVLREIYQYDFDLIKLESDADLPVSAEHSVLIHQGIDASSALAVGVPYQLFLMGDQGSILAISGAEVAQKVAAVQHVRRRESIAMTPQNTLDTLKFWLGIEAEPSSTGRAAHQEAVRASIAQITGAQRPALIASSGLSIQYAIMMGLIDQARRAHPTKEIKIIVPPNCYGGTNDQARRVAAALDSVGILDLPVDGENDMVASTDRVLNTCAEIDAVPLIIAEIPTNPRVEVPDLEALRAVLLAKRSNPQGGDAVDPVFILDQTFCPNVRFLEEVFAGIRTISYVSGSKFPSGGKCTAGYCVANSAAADLLTDIEKHLVLCDNEATSLQLAILEEQMPSMNERIAKAYQNTAEFVRFIRETLPEVKINFVSKALAERGFTPSVFSLDLPTKGDNPHEREMYKRELNQRLIDMMIGEIPQESKYCVSYGQLKGCYWTIPATSTQGTTKEADKDYIARVSVSPQLDLAKHKQVFQDFVATL